MVTGGDGIPDGDGIPEAGAGKHRTLAERLEHRRQVRLPARHNSKLTALIDAVNADDDLYALWVAANVNAVDRLGMSDHGPVHVHIVANSSLRLLRLLVDGGVTPGIVTNYGLEP